MKLSAYGIVLDLPAGWDGRIYRRPGGDPTLHAGTFPLPPDDGDFGTGALSTMGARGAFIVLTEYDPALAGRGLFAPAGLPPPLRELDAHPSALLHAVRGQLGLQRFFSAAGRAFCLYVVVGSLPDPATWIERVNGVLRTVLIGTIPGPPGTAATVPTEADGVDR